MHSEKFEQKTFWQYEIIYENTIMKNNIFFQETV